MRFSFSSLGVLGSWNGCFIFMRGLIASWCRLVVPVGRTHEAEKEESEDGNMHGSFG